MNIKNFLILCFVSSQITYANQLPEYVLNHECTSDEGIKRRYDDFMIFLDFYLNHLDQICRENFYSSDPAGPSFCRNIQRLKSDLRSSEISKFESHKELLSRAYLIQRQIFGELSSTKKSENRNIKEMYWIVHDKLESFKDCLVIKQFHEALQQHQKLKK